MLLAHHAKLLMEFKAAVNHPENTAPASPESQKAYHHSNDFKAACMKLAIKCADISNPARPWGLYSEWIPKVMVRMCDVASKEYPKLRAHVSSQQQHIGFTEVHKAERRTLMVMSHSTQG